MPRPASSCTRGYRLGVPLVAAGNAELDPLRPVVVGREGAVLGVALDVRGLVHRDGRHHGGGLDCQPRGGEAFELLEAARRGVHGDGDVAASGNASANRASQPESRRCPARTEQQEVAPPERRVVGRPHDEVVAAVLDDAPPSRRSATSVRRPSDRISIAPSGQLGGREGAILDSRRGRVKVGPRAPVGEGRRGQL